MIINAESIINFSLPCSLNRSLIRCRNRHFLYLLLSSLLFFSAPARSEGPKILVYGDSVSAAYGMQIEQGWVHLLSTRLEDNHPDYQLINASVSGETTGGGLARLPKTLALHQPDILILELGGNDGLRGYPITKIEANLNAMIELAQSANTKILLVGMVLPPNYGRRYTSAFENLYVKVSQASNIQFLPFLLQGVATSESLLQRDGIHPKIEAQAMLLDNIWPHLLILLK